MRINWFLLQIAAWLPILGVAFTAQAYTGLVTFGDSYTDTGRLPSSPPQYWNGRFSNGPLWVEYLSQQLGFGYDPNNNLAVSGSESDMLGVQIGNFPGVSPSEPVVFAIWSGNNDFGAHLNFGTSDSAWNKQMTATLNSLMTACELLYQKGARLIVVFNQLDITKLPQIRENYSGSFRSYLQGKIATFNSRLAQEVATKQSAHPDLQLLLLDIHMGFDSLLTGYIDYGFSTATLSALDDRNLVDKSFGGPGASYVFWDGQHPTTKTHSLIANLVANLLPSSPPPPPPPPPDNLPPPWSQWDIGSVGQEGAGGASNGTFIVTGSGSDIWDTADAFHFVCQPWSGDGVLMVRVAGLSYTDGFAKAGIMFRESLNANAANVLAFITPTGTVGVQIRSLAGSTTSYFPWLQQSFPYWLKIERAGTVFNTYASSDGASWMLMETQELSMGTNVYVGLAVTAHNNTLLATAQFDSLQLTGPVAAPSISISSPAPNAHFQAPAWIQVTAAVSTSSPPSQVEFLHDGVLLGIKTAAPYTLVWTNVIAGTYALQVRATYANNQTSVSESVAVFVSPRVTVQPLQNGTVQVVIYGDAGTTYRTDVSTNLVTWLPFSTNVVTTGPISVLDSHAQSAQDRFYRVVGVP